MMNCNNFSCKEVEELILKFACGEAGPTELAEVKEHLDRCVGCRRERDILADILDQLKGCQAECCIPDGFRERVLVRIKTVVRTSVEFRAE
jgi:predicted anti-sigma-YlaC factor YlaD